MDFKSPLRFNRGGFCFAAGAVAIWSQGFALAICALCAFMGVKMLLLNTHIRALMVLLLLITGQSVANARGGSMIVGQMVICTGYGPTTVYVDATGAPAQPPHHCPDCSIQLYDASDFAMPQRAMMAVLVADYLPPVLPDVPALAPQTPAPRGPPRFVL